MVYMGSKRKYCKYIVPIIQNYIDSNGITTFVDCFCGGANLADKINCNNVIANDLSPTLIALHKKGQSNPQSIPSTGNREWWDKAYAEYKKILKGASPEDINMEYWKIGAIEWYNSFSNGGFARGYAKPNENRDYYNEAYKNHQKQCQLENYKKINFICGDYRDITFPDNNVLLYCDSPYKNTKPYQIQSKFNFKDYYNWLRETSKKYPIFISEQNMPEDFNNIVWEKDDVKRTCGEDNNFKACEKLYFIDNRRV